MSAFEPSEAVRETDHTERKSAKGAAPEQDKNIELPKTVGQMTTGHLRTPITDSRSSSGERSSNGENELAGGKEIRGTKFKRGDRKQCTSKHSQQGEEQRHDSEAERALQRRLSVFEGFGNPAKKQQHGKQHENPHGLP